MIHKHWKRYARVAVAVFTSLLLTQASPLGAAPKDEAEPAENLLESAAGGMTADEMPRDEVPVDGALDDKAAAEGIPVAAEGSFDSYSLSLFSEETVLRNPNASATGSFVLHNGGKVTGPVNLDLWYSYTPTILTQLSFISVSVNGIPVASQPLRAESADAGNWQVTLPEGYLRPGANNITVDVVHRSIDGLCRDIDDPANWFILRPATKVTFGLLRDPYTLASFPRPFLDDYLASKVNTVFYLPETADVDVFAGLLNLASAWGKQGLSGSRMHRLEIRYGALAAASDANEIVLGSGEGLPVLELGGLPGGFTRLSVSGAGNKDLAAALGVLARPQLVKTFQGSRMALDVSQLPKQDGSRYFNKGNDKKGSYTLADLGQEDDIPAAGAFHQEVDITVPRPAGYGIGDGSYIELHFRHSPILDPKKSAVTIYVNDIPVRAQALTAENAEQGVLKAPIPASELDRQSWRVRFGFYHDLGIIDCSKRYDEVAWSVVEKNTSVYLKEGEARHIPSWEFFPTDFGVDDKNVIQLTMLLPDSPSAQELTAAFKLAYFISQQNNGPVHWQAQTVSSFDVKKAVGSVIAIGSHEDTRLWQTLKEQLPVVPEGVSYRLAPWVEAIPAYLRNFDICGIGHIGQGQTVYGIMYTDADRLEKLLFYKMMNQELLSGQLTLVDAQGKAVTFTEPKPEKAPGIGAMTEKFGTVGIYAAVVAGVIIVTGLVLFMMRRRAK